MKATAGLLTLSAREHKHNLYEIIYYVKGAGEFYFSDESIAISPGKFIVIPPDVIHSSIYTDETETLYIRDDFNHIFSFSSPVTIMDNSANAGRFLMNMILENRFSNDEYLASLSNALAHFLMQSIQPEKNISKAALDIANTISDNFFDCTLNVGELLKKSGYAKDYIRAHFKLLTKKTPIEFLTEARINHACFLINVYKDSLHLTEIAEKCGYTDYIYFSRRFKQIVGVSPQKYIEK